MSKAKTNTLDTLRALIAERQQYEQWISTLEAKRDGTPGQVFERVHNDYRSRLERVSGEIKGHADELQLSISTLSSRLVEVAREEDTRREGLQEAELRAAVGEYEPSQWEQIRSESEEALEKIAADRVSLDSQLSELRAIQKLAEMNPQLPASESASPVRESAVAGEPSPSTERKGTSTAEPIAAKPPGDTASDQIELAPPAQGPGGHRSGTAAAVRDSAEAHADAPAKQPVAATPATAATPPGERIPLSPVAAAASAASSSVAKPRTRTPPGGVSAARSRTEAAKPDTAKTLKCPECGTANYPTEWYCERCGGELATM